jgi:chemotaxis protein CheD
MSATETRPPMVERETVVNVADFGVARGRGLLCTSGLGSCVAVIVYDAKTRTAALAHVLLPDIDYGRGPVKPAKYASTAVALLVAEIRRVGGTGRLVAKLAGGARMFGSLLSSGVNMGERNVEATRRALAAAGVPIVAEDVGGEHGRSIYFDVATGAMRVHSLQRGDRVL